MSDIAKCSLCGEPMPAGEEMFKYHGYSGSCPKPVRKNEYEPWKALGLTETEYFKMRYLEAIRQRDVAVRALEEIKSQANADSQIDDHKINAAVFKLAREFYYREADEALKELETK
jgi:hypothetical protein